MKNSIAILSLTALVAASVQTASAGNREWATVGKVLTGVAAVHVISHALHPAPVYVAAPPQVVYVPVYVNGPPPGPGAVAQQQPYQPPEAVVMSDQAATQNGTGAKRSCCYCCKCSKMTPEERQNCRDCLNCLAVSAMVCSCLMMCLSFIR